MKATGAVVAVAVAVNGYGDIGVRVVADFCALRDARTPTGRIVAHHHNVGTFCFEQRLQVLGNRQREFVFGVAIVGGGATGIAGFGDAINGVDKLIDLGRVCGVAAVMAGVDGDDFAGERKFGDRRRGR